MILIQNADQLLCGSWDAYDAFQEVLGSPELLALKGCAASRPPVVMVGACTLGEGSASLARAGGGGSSSSAGGSGGPGSGAGLGDEDEGGGGGEEIGRAHV